MIYFSTDADCGPRRREVFVKLATLLPYGGDFHAAAQEVAAMESAGLDAILVPEAYSFDAISRVGYLIPVTSPARHDGSGMQRRLRRQVLPGAGRQVIEGFTRCPMSGRSHAPGPFV